MSAAHLPESLPSPLSPGLSLRLTLSDGRMIETTVHGERPLSDLAEHLVGVAWARLVLTRRVAISPA